MSSDSLGQGPKKDVMDTSPPPATRSEGPALWRSDAKALKRSGSDKPGDLLRVLSRAMRNAALYGAVHPFILETFTTLQQLLQASMASRPSIRIFIHEDTFFIENTVLLEDSLQLHGLLKAFEERQISAIQIDAGVEPWELKHLVEILNLDPKEVLHLGGASAYLEEHKVHHVKLGAIAGMGMAVGFEGAAGRMGGKDGQSGSSSMPEAPTTPSGVKLDPRALKLDPQDAYRAGLRLQDELTYQASANLPLSLRKAHLVVNSFIDIIAQDGVALPAIAIMKNYDEETYHHSVNVCILSLLIGTRLKLNRELLLALGFAALLHDIGKVRVPLEILAKPARLTPVEMEAMKRHPVYGAHALRDLPGISRLAMIVAFEHHANYNLSGYPRIGAKKMPHLLTRIVQVADVYDAMTSTRRVYRRPLLREEALKVIQDGAGTVYDPVVAKLSLQILAGLSRELDNRASQSQS